MRKGRQTSARAKMSPPELENSPYVIQDTVSSVPRNCLWAFKQLLLKGRLAFRPGRYIKGDMARQITAI
jgi:hypothetical protein